ncbi:MAG: BMP family ABC transporter substrate-binding protein [Synergistaceae bacterium]|jgi:basic membrane protein A|nr:BMP family ABC transporter substrate-binding protein [Synergistaceae bacterium]
MKTMNWQRGILLALIALSILYILGSCSSAATLPTLSPNTSGKKIKLVLVVQRIHDMSFQQSAYDGTQRIKDKLGDYYDVQVEETGSDSTVLESAIYDVCDKGADIVIGMGFENLENFQNIPPEYPNIKFILLDEVLNYSGKNLSNLLTVTFKSSESGFLAGAVAAYYTTPHGNPAKTVGFVGGTEAVTVTDFLVGYAEGVHYVDPSIKILTAYVGNYFDSAKAKDLANAQIAEGADIIFQAAGGAGNGVIEAAAEAEKVMAIGVDSDQYKILEGTNLQSCIITSSLKHLDNALFIIATQYAADPSSVAFGSTVTFDLEDDAVGIVFNDHLTASIGENNVSKIRELQTKIQTGEIVVSEAASLTADQIANIVKGNQ